MNGSNSKHQRRWASDSVPGKSTVSAGTSPGSDSTFAGDEFVEVTLDLRDDDTIVLRSVEPASVINVIDDGGASSSGCETPAAVSRSPTIRRTSSRGLRHFSQELKAEAVAKARQFSQELKAELRRFSWSHGHGSRASSSSAPNGTGGAGGAVETALAARALRKQRAQLDRTRCGAHKALRGLRFISSKSNGVDPWIEVQRNFDTLSSDGYLYRDDFGQCIGPFRFRISLALFD